MKILKFNDNIGLNDYKTNDGNKVRIIIDDIVNKKDTHDCNLSYSCLSSNVIDCIKLNDNERSDKNIPILYGGSKESKVISKNTKNSIDIKKLGMEIIKEIRDKYPFIYHSNNNDNRLVEIIYDLCKKKKFKSINKLEYELLLRFIRDNLFTSFKEEYTIRHPLFDDDFTNMYKDTIPKIEQINREYFINHSEKVAFTQAISNIWTDIGDFITNGNIRIKFEKSGMIHPLFFLLFATKHPGFEDLCIQQDLITMSENISNNYFDKRHLFLLTLRYLDKSLLPSDNMHHMSIPNNENLRRCISMLLREICLSLRSGNFVCKSSDLLLKLLQEIKMPNTSFEEERLMHSILAVYSYRPTLVTKSKFNSIFDMDQRMRPLPTTPSAVYTIQYRLQDFNSSLQTNETPIFSELNFVNMGYDKITGRLICIYSDEEDISLSTSKDELMTNMYRTLHSKVVEADIKDVFSTLLSKSGYLNSMYKDITPAKVLLTNGMFILSVTRYQDRLSVYPAQNIFFNSTMKPIINISPILFKELINLNKIGYELTGALCYDFIDENQHYGFGSADYIDADSKLGLIAYIKTSYGWVEYSPNDICLINRKNDMVNRALKNNFIFEHNNGNINDYIIEERENLFEEWKKTPAAQKITENVLNDKISIVDLIIPTNEALEKISTKSCLLFYGENYNDYRDRLDNKLFEVV